MGRDYMLQLQIRVGESVECWVYFVCCGLRSEEKPFEIHTRYKMGMNGVITNGNERNKNIDDNL